jgi:hypothetical protein
MHPVLLARPTEHIVAFYRSDDFVVEQIASFISEGLAANERVIAIPTTITGTPSLPASMRAVSTTAVRPAPDGWF